MASAILNTVHVSRDPFLLRLPSWLSPDPAPESDAPPPEFEFRLVDPVAMLPADELFSDGMLLPLPLKPPLDPRIRFPDSHKVRIESEIARSPKAPRCSSRWKELFGLKRAAQRAAATQRTPNPNPNPRNLKHLLTRNPKPQTPDPSLSTPLLRDHDAITRLPAHGDLPRLSLDAAVPRLRLSAADRGRVGRSPSRALAGAPRCASVDSPRMNSSGKVVFQNLGRSASSPGSFAGGGARRSFSANVAPVLNVPVCKGVAVFGFGQLFSPQKRDGRSCRSHGGAGGNIR